MTKNNMHWNGSPNDSICLVADGRPSRGKCRFLTILLFVFAATYFVVDSRREFLNEGNRDKATLFHRMNLLDDTNVQIKAKDVFMAEMAHLLDPYIILIPDYPNQTNLSVVEHDIASKSGSNNEKEVSPLALCNPTAQVEISFTQPHWTLATFDKHGNKKNVGGDEFYIVYHDITWKRGAAAVIALIQDHENGTYTLDFVTTPMKPILPKLVDGLGNLTIYFDYTCGIGSLAPPVKQHWNNKGSTGAVFTRTNVPQPRFRLFQHPPKPVNLSNFDFVNFIGASTMRDLILQADEQWQPRVHLQQDFRSPLNTTTVDNFIRKTTRPETLLGNITTNASIALILGSDVWDILSNEPNQGAGFEDHLSACARVVMLAKMLYPDVTVLWK
jgi:hypothetical protein